MSAGVAPEIAAALEHAGLRARRFELVSAIRSPDARKATWRIDLTDGRTIKARRVHDEEAARRLFAIRRVLPAAFAPAFARQGNVLLEEWIEGTVLGDGLDDGAGDELGGALGDRLGNDLGDGLVGGTGVEAREAASFDAHVAAAGSLLARLHATSSVLGEPVLDSRPTAQRRDDTERSLASFVAADALPSRVARALRQDLARTDPGEARFGLVHTDLCGENIVVDRAGTLHVVDNERLGIDALGYDLGRVWCRWPLAPRRWQIFRSAYAGEARAARGDDNDALAGLAFWSVVAVVKSAEIRLRLDRDRAHVPLDRLRRMATEVEAER